MNHTYDNKWMVGDSALEINQDDDNFYLGGKQYKGTPGLYELLFMKHPVMYVYRTLSKRIQVNTSKHQRTQAVSFTGRKRRKKQRNNCRHVPTE